MRIDSQRAKELPAQPGSFSCLHNDRGAEDTPRNICEIIPETQEWLCDIKLHTKDPNDRYQSAREVADVLANQHRQIALTEAGLHARPSPAA